MIISNIETIRVGQFPDLLFTQVHTDTGIVGLGETWYAAPTVESAIHDYFGPLLVGRNPSEIERHWQNFCAAACLEISRCSFRLDYNLFQAVLGSVLPTLVGSVSFSFPCSIDSPQRHFRKQEN